MADMVFIARVQKRGERYGIEIPKDMADQAKNLQGKTLKVTIKELDLNKL